MAKRTAVGEVPKSVSDRMRKVRSTDTPPEVKLRKALWANGHRYRICPRDLPGKPDLVFPARRTVIFVDGDFWHGNQWSRRGLRCLEEQFAGSANREYWLRKIRGNIDRDCRRTTELLDRGWTVLRLWESEVESRLDQCVAAARSALEGRARPSVRDRAPLRTTAEFFAGIGLMRLGLDRAGWRTAFANDIDPKKQRMYLDHFGPEAEFTLADVHSLDPARVPAVTLATASFPCNDLSLAGARSGLAGEHSSAFWGFLRVLEQQGAERPPVVLLENVEGFLTSKRGEDLRTALSALNDLGYAVDAFLLDARFFVPQSRPRLFIVAVRAADDRPVNGYSGFLDHGSLLRPKKLADFIYVNCDIAWRLRDLPEPPEPATTLEAIVEDLADDSDCWWDQDRADYLFGQMSERHRAVAERMIGQPRWSSGTVFRRVRKGKSMAELRNDGVAGCLRTPRGGSGRQILFRAGFGRFKVRLLTPRECARLMGAGEFRIDVPSNQALFGFGDAVCASAIEWIAKYYLQPVVNELMHGHPLLPRDR